MRIGGRGANDMCRLRGRDRASGDSAGPAAEDMPQVRGDRVAEGGGEAEMDLVEKAEAFAERAHAGQKRKYTGHDYTAHLSAVAAIVATVPHTQEVIAAAFLHDTVEDTKTALADIQREFGAAVASLVEQLTDVSRPSDGNRAVRKALDREHLAAASPEAQTIKLADLLDNTASIVEHDPKFAAVYLPEKEALLAVLTKGDATLHARARAAITSGRAKLANS
jgi:(p)ppGpp synthase/HD superfamily hydrolase